MSSFGIELKSSHTHALVGSPVKLSTARMMKQSNKVLVFLTSGYLNSELSHFELDLLKMRSSDDVVVVTVNADLVAYMNTCLADILRDSRHLVFPVGICSGGEANYQAFLKTLATKIRGQPTRNTENL